ncbi:MAG: hypothetical protein R3F59_15030 [Myxococcota bacterium]
MMGDAVTQEAGCVRAFLWNVDHGLPGALVLARLEAAGWQGKLFAGALWIFAREPAYDKVVFVPATGRLQVRVDMARPYEERRGVAEDVHRALCEPADPAPPVA